MPFSPLGDISERHSISSVAASLALQCHPQRSKLNSHFLLNIESYSLRHCRAAKKWESVFEQRHKRAMELKPRKKGVISSGEVAQHGGTATRVLIEKELLRYPHQYQLILMKKIMLALVKPELFLQES